MSKWSIPLVAALMLAACAPGGGYQVSATYATASPEANLVEVSPGVYAVGAVDQPEFYVNGNYWLYSNGQWYQSDDYRTGWRVHYSPPIALRRIDPFVYVNRRREAFRHRRVHVIRGPHPIDE